MSPEKGIRALGVEALDIIEGPVKNCVQSVYTLLLNAARCARGTKCTPCSSAWISRPFSKYPAQKTQLHCRESAERAGEHTEAALMGSLPMYVPDFKTVVMPAISSALDEWKNEAEKSE